MWGRCGGALSILAAIIAGLIAGSPVAAPDDLDVKVTRFLQSQQWQDLNVPAVDGRTLHDLIVRQGYTRALEIGTSTGHSGIWMAWALSKTGGRLVTVEMDERRYRQALRNFAEAGVDGFVDARWGDAHTIVPALEGPFDFVFSDADKSWYRRYLEDVLPKLAPGGCYVTHNVTSRGLFGGGSREYVDFLLSLPGLKTEFDTRGGGMAVSFKQRD